ncbi:MAG TPA: OmpA family protein [Methylomirabilota bacterium]|nr:OmpA family protein [Methylomirabilota bacterium]
MPKQTWIVAGVLSGIVLITVVLIAIRKQSVENARIQRALVEAQSAQEKQVSDLAALSNKLSEAEAAIADLKEENEHVTKTQHSLEDEMRKALESKDVTISELKGKLTVNILDRILFDSGEAELKPEGQRILEKIAGVLTQHTNRQIHVIGHTDDVPMRRKFPSNWELSTARATAAVRFLQERAGFDPRRLGALGYGEFHPIAPNTTVEGRAKNRRIEVVILPEELIAPTLTAEKSAPGE